MFVFECADYFSQLSSLFLRISPHFGFLLSDCLSGAITCFFGFCSGSPRTSTSSPPQMRHVEMLKTKNLRKIMQLVCSKSRCQQPANSSEHTEAQLHCSKLARAKSGNALLCALSEHGIQDSWRSTCFSSCCNRSGLELALRLEVL